jgi:hypothetical protein
MLSRIARVNRSIEYVGRSSHKVRGKRFCSSSSSSYSKSKTSEGSANWKLFIGIPLGSLLFAAYEGSLFENIFEPEDPRSTAIASQKSSQEVLKLDTAKVDVLKIAKKIAHAITGNDADVVFTFDEMKWIATNSLDDIKHVKKCDFHLESITKIGQLPNFLKKFYNLTSVKTNAFGLNLEYPRSLKHLSVSIKESWDNREGGLNKSISETNLETFEMIYEGRDKNASINLMFEDIPKTLKVFKVVAPYSKIWKREYTYYSWHVVPALPDLGSFKNLEIFDVKSQSINITTCPSTLKFVRCKSFDVENFKTGMHLAANIEHFEADVKSEVCAQIMADNPNLKTLKVNCNFNQSMMQNLPKDLKTLSVGKLKKSDIRFIPNSCENVVIGSIEDDLSKADVVWPSKLQTLSIGGTQVDPAIYKTIPTTTKSLSLPEDQCLTDFHIVMNNVIPSNVTYLALNQNKNVTIASLHVLVQRNCKVIVDLDRNQQNYKLSEERIRKAYSEYLKEQL